MSSSRWTFHDPVLSDSYSFNVNPNSDQTTFTKNLQFEPILIPGNPPLLYEGADTATTLMLQGTLLTQEQHQTLCGLFARRHQMQLTDDRGLVRWVYIYEYDATRTPNALFPWKMTWNMSLYVISQSFPA